MSIEISRAIARVAATELVKRHGLDVKELTNFIDEYIFDELPGLDPDTSAQVEKLIAGYLQVADIHIGINDFRVNDDGSLKTEDELRQGLQVDPIW